MGKYIDRIKRDLLEFFQIWKVNLRALVAFELFYKAVSAAIFMPLLYGGFHRILVLTGYEYLTAENIRAFLLHPITIVGMLLLLLFYVFITFIDISGVIFLFDQSSIGRQVGLFTTLRFAAWNSIRIFYPKNLSMAVTTLLSIAYMKAAVVYGFVGVIRMPEMFQRVIDRNWYIQFGIIVGLVLVAFFLLRNLYSFFFFTLEQDYSVRANARSRRRPVLTYVFDVLCLLLIQLLFLLVYQVTSKIGVAVIDLIQHMVSDFNAPIVVILSAAMVFLIAVLTILSALSTPISFAIISIRYYRYMGGQKRHHILAKEIHISERYRRNIARFMIAAFMVAMLLTSTYIVGFAKGDYSIRMEEIHAIAVTAHRGASTVYPENTMAAFEGAMEQGADWIELDVQQSRDGYIFVSHDTNFKRITGVDKNSWEMDYEDIAKLDAGSFLSSEFADETMPLLTDVIEFAKLHNLKLNIELKPTGYETDFEKSVVDIINDEFFAGSCVVTSQKYQVLKNVKAYDEDIKTIYVTSLAYGDVGHLDAADGYSVEASSISEQLVERVHNEGKEIYGWTVNTKAGVNRLIRLGVDNIITDNVPMVQTCIYRSKAGNALTEYVQWLESYH